MLYIFRTNCPLTNDEWKKRAKEVCKSQPENYHCMYNIDCKLEEFCNEKGKNYFQYYLRADPTFFKEERRDMTTNSMDYWYIQYFLHCKNILITEKPMILSKTDLSCTSEDVYWKLLIVFIIVSVVAIGLLIYILRNRIESLARRGYSICINRNENN